MNLYLGVTGTPLAITIPYPPNDPDVAWKVDSFFSTRGRYAYTAVIDHQTQTVEFVNEDMYRFLLDAFAKSTIRLDDEEGLSTFLAMPINHGYVFQFDRVIYDHCPYSYDSGERKCLFLDANLRAELIQKRLN
jgi:hypothetical protein